MSKRCNLIGFGEINKYYLLIIVEVIIDISFIYIAKEAKTYTNGTSNLIIDHIIYSIGLCLSFFLILFYRIYNRRKNFNYEIINIKKQVVGSPQNEQTTKLEKFLWILLISFIDFAMTIYSCFNFLDGIVYLNVFSFEMVFYSLFSYLILKIKLYKHHYVCISIVLIFSVLFDIILHNFEEGNTINNLLNYLLQAVLGLYYILFKYIMLKKYIKSYEILTFEGFIELILGIITLIITTNIGYLDNFNDYIMS